MKKKERIFFFEEKKQKTFVYWHMAAGGTMSKSLFASFSSEKEDSSL
jgi:hypothetical protein